ncbi:PIN domain-containing protein [Sphingomonas sp. A2-49]|uniref:PIN domain-containing protein n=1 Tax=Sphingomonas sp. A2-49 TaxID=1391375 RepID=UPI0021D103C3|nr:PIN domain-containing protein [Sphingomonas sp. A2-49]MCU6454951.1 PIN domain-containing protein [Sphingomonas sp. A2-49]
MSGYSLDANILIDALLGHEPAHVELARIGDTGEELRISRMAWIEVLSKGGEGVVREALQFLGRFALDEIDEDIALRAAALRRQRAGLKSPDAVILATAQMRGRILVTRNTRDFPANMPGVRIPYTL